MFSPAAQIFRNNKLDASFFSLEEEIKHRYCKRMDPCWSKDQAWPSKRMRCCNTNSGLKAFTNVDNNQLAYNCWDAGENTCIGVCGLRCEIMTDGEHLQRRKFFCVRYFRFPQRAKNESDAEPGYTFFAPMQVFQLEQGHCRGPKLPLRGVFTRSSNF